MGRIMSSTAALDEKTTKRTECRNPATGEVTGHSPLDNVETVQSAIERARAAQSEWANLPVYERCRSLRVVRDLIVDGADELAEIISADTGKTRIDAMAAEVLPAAIALDYYTKQAYRFLKDRRLKAARFLLGNKRSMVRRVPFGVVGIISPWNYPFAIPFSEVVMALLAGNGVVLKVATQTQMVGRALESLFQEADLPDGLFAHVNLPGRLAGDAFLEGGVNKLFFTGSVPVGKQLMAKAAETLTPVVLELGGNDPMLVCPDANLDRAAGGAVWAGMHNAGQSCGGVERIYVHADVYDAFLDRLGELVKSLRIGPDDGNDDVDIGAVTTAQQAETIRQHIEAALADGAQISAQAECPEGGAGRFIGPTVLVNVNHSMQVMREETFGPVVGVMKVTDMQEAVRLANDLDLGLTASVWSRDKRAAEALARQLQAGVVTINDHLMSHGLPETPWGGFKQSGIGRTHGQIGFDEMTQPQCIVHDQTGFLRRNLWWHPFSPDVYAGMKGLLEMMYGNGTGRRLAGARAVLKILPRTWRK
jgi:acyl-CoA reductase-like NAD-dependent aldehyde dehydrogenase